jgi:hypothetical protein
VQTLVASQSDVERLLRLHRVATVAELVEEMLAWGDAPVFLDEDGRLRVRDEEPNPFPRTYVNGEELRKLFAHYAVAPPDLAALRRRMILEGAWRPDQVGVDADGIFVAVDPRES